MNQVQCRRPLKPQAWDIQAHRPRVSLATGRLVGWNAGCRADIRDVLLSAGPDDRLSVSAADAVASLPRLLPSLLGTCGVRSQNLELILSVDHVAWCTIETLLALSALRDLGIGVALAGLRGHQLSLLPRLPLSAVILEPGLVACLPWSRQAMDEIQGMAAAAQALDLHVVAPGIETWEQYALLRGCGVTYGEGELFDPRR